MKDITNTEEAISYLEEKRKELYDSMMATGGWTIYKNHNGTGEVLSEHPLARHIVTLDTKIARYKSMLEDADDDSNPFDVQTND